METASVTHRLRHVADADEVRLRTFMPRFPSEVAFDREDGGWVLDLELPADARIEYLIERRVDGHSSVIIHPENPDTAANPFGENSVLVGPAYDRKAWPPEPIAGTVTEIRVASAAFGGRRHHLLYAPPNVRPDQPCPLLVVHDGNDYVRYAGLLTCLERLTSDGAISPVRVVGLNPRARHDQYVASTRQVAHVVDEVLPHVRGKVAFEERIVVMGASLGGVAAWHLAWSRPDLVRAAFLQSGTFAMDSHPELDDAMTQSISSFVEAGLAEPRLGEIDVFQTCGRYESLIEWNRVVASAMADDARTHSYREGWTGHDWGAWSGWMAEGFRTLLGEPSL